MQQYRWECVQVLEGHHDRTIFSVAWGEGKVGSLGWIASASGDGQITVYQADVSPLLFSNLLRSQEGEQGGEGGRIEVKVLTKTAPAHGVYDINSVAWCPRKGFESYLASCGDDGSVKVWKVQVGK